MNNTKTRKLVEASLMIAASVLLSFIKLYEAPLGGSVTLLSMAPLMIVSIRLGIGWGLGSSFVFAMIKLWLGAGNFSYVPTLRGIVCTVILDYLLAYTAIGLAGIFRKARFAKSEKTNLYVTTLLGVFTACIVRFACHFVNGAVVWYEITKVGEWNDYVQKAGMWLYSFVYNISYLGPEIVLTLAAVPVIVRVLSLKSIKNK